MTSERAGDTDFDTKLIEVTGLAFGFTVLGLRHKLLRHKPLRFKARLLNGLFKRLGHLGHPWTLDVQSRAPVGRQWCVNG